MTRFKKILLIFLSNILFSVTLISGGFIVDAFFINSKNYKIIAILIICIIFYLSIKIDFKTLNKLYEDREEEKKIEKTHT